MMDTTFMVPIRSRTKHAAKQAFMENADLEAVFWLLKKRKDIAAPSFSWSAICFLTLYRFNRGKSIGKIYKL